LKGLFSDALPIYNSANDETQNHPDIIADRAFCHFHLRNIESCLTDLKKAQELQPKYALRYSCLGYVYQLTGQQQEAKGWYKKALQLDPKESVALHNLGMIEKPSIQPLMNPELIRKKILKTFIEFHKQFPNPEDQKKMIDFLRNGAKNK
jgi:tetratricopeptide (TPR) repeat protein